jgi:hypothetical protein
MAGDLSAFQDWRREREAVEKEMDRLVAAGRPNSPEERQVRQLQFTALIARRDAAARNLLKADAAALRSRAWHKAPTPGATAGSIKPV